MTNKRIRPMRMVAGKALARSARKPVTLMAMDFGSPDGDKAVMIEAERQPDGTLKMVSYGELIEGESVPLDGKRKIV